MCVTQTGDGQIIGWLKIPHRACLYSCHRLLVSGRQRMGRSWPRCCAISGLVTAVLGAVLALTFPLLYHAILNYVRILFFFSIFLCIRVFIECSPKLSAGIVAAKRDAAIQIMDGTASIDVHEVLPLQYYQHRRYRQQPSETHSSTTRTLYLQVRISSYSRKSFDNFIDPFFLFTEKRTSE